MASYALILCAAHVPPRCKGRTKCACECHAGLPAGRTALSPKKVTKTAPSGFPNCIWRHPEPYKFELGGSKKGQIRPRAPQRHGKGAQETTKSAQKLAKGAPDAPKTSLGSPKASRKTRLASSKSHFGRDCPQQACSRGWLLDFLGCFTYGALYAKCVPTQ